MEAFCHTQVLILLRKWSQMEDEFQIEEWKWLEKEEVWLSKDTPAPGVALPWSESEEEWLGNEESYRQQAEEQWVAMEEKMESCADCPELITMEDLIEFNAQFYERKGQLDRRRRQWLQKEAWYKTEEDDLIESRMLDWQLAWRQREHRFLCEKCKQQEMKAAESREEEEKIEEQQVEEAAVESVEESAPVAEDVESRPPNFPREWEEERQALENQVQVLCEENAALKHENEEARERCNEVEGRVKLEREKRVKQEEENAKLKAEVEKLRERLNVVENESVLEGDQVVETQELEENIRINAQQLPTMTTEEEVQEIPPKKKKSWFKCGLFRKRESEAAPKKRRWVICPLFKSRVSLDDC